MRYVSFKTNCRFKRYTPALEYMLRHLSTLQNIGSWVPDLVVTSVNDSQHSPNSRHYTDEAIDIRTKTFKCNEDVYEFIRMYRALLGDKFTLLFESVDTPNEHLHVQVKKGMTFP